MHFHRASIFVIRPLTLMIFVFLVPGLRAQPGKDWSLDSNVKTSPASPIFTKPEAILRVNADGHHFVDGNRRYVFMLGDTQWELFREFSTDEASELFDLRRKQGFRYIQVFLTGVFPEADSFRTIKFSSSQRAWVNGDPLTPDESYFSRVDSIVELAAQQGIALVIGVYHTKDQQMGRVTMENARAWARWLGARYQQYPNIIWSMYPNSKEAAKPLLEEVIKGLNEGDSAHHLITVHPDPGPSSSGFLGNPPWLAFNTLQTFNSGFINHRLVKADYESRPARPVINGEARYETEAGTTAFDIRKSAWFSVLAGGGYTYGHGMNWMKPRPFKVWVESDGAKQMKVMADFFRSVKWWELKPADSSRVSGENENALAVSDDGTWILAYITEKSNGHIRVGTRLRLGANVWRIDPRTGAKKKIGVIGRIPVLQFHLPKGWQDMVLLIK
jgi:hypothetical protein